MFFYAGQPRSMWARLAQVMKDAPGTQLRMALAVMLSGLAAGLLGAAMVWLLLRIQSLTYGLASTSLLGEVTSASGPRKILGPAVGGLLAGCSWWWLRRKAPVATVEEAVQATPPGQLPLGRTLADALTQILVVGSGASIGREGAPRQGAATVAHTVATRLRISEAGQRTLMACAAGAGLAAVYNVPVAGVAFTFEVLGAPRRWSSAASAVSMSVIATVVAWPVVTNSPTYDFPDLSADRAVIGWSALWAVACIPLCAIVGRAFRRIAQAATRARPGPGLRLPLSVAAASGLVGLASVWLPPLPGNGKDVLQLTFSTAGTAALFVVMFILKPLATALCLRSGAVGGLLTPALATGAALGAAAALPAQHAAAVHVQIFALLAAGGVLAVTQQAPFFATAMTWELTHAPRWTIPLLLIAAYGAHHTSTRDLRPPWTQARHRDDGTPPGGGA